MQWREIHGNLEGWAIPFARGGHTMTKISSTSALIYGGNYFNEAQFAWVLDMQKAREGVTDPLSLWKDIACNLVISKRAQRAMMKV